MTMPFCENIPHLKTDTALTICSTVLRPPSGPAPLACTTTAYSFRPPLSTRWITVRWLALFGKTCQPRLRLSPGLRAFTAVVGQAPSVLRSPASAAYKAAPDSRNARSERRSSSAVRSATTARSPMIASEKITAGRTNPRRRLCMALVGPQLRPGPCDDGQQLARRLRQRLVVMELGAARRGEGRPDHRAP